ncbi:MAG: glycosyltransferase [Lachnospiraceae bacterium]|nr:glycosyltransferase [Lachnospiraceae bacterium]
MKSKSVIFVTISMTGGGTERVIAVLANYWASRGVKVSVLMIGGDDIAYELAPEIDIKCISKATAGDMKARLNRIREMRNCFKEDGDAVIIAMGTVASIFSSLAITGLKNRLILSERNDPNRLNHRPIKGYEKAIRNLLYRRANNVVFQTKMAEEAFPAYIKKTGVVISNPIKGDMPVVTAYSDRKKTVITAGRLTEQKNHKMLIDAFVMFHKEHNEYDLKIYGDGDQREILKDYISDTGADEYIKLMGFAENIHEVMNESAVYVSSSDWEGISNSLMEAMAMGMAVIATDCPLGGSSLLIESGVNGILVSPGDVTEMYKALCTVADEKIARLYADNAVKVRKKNSADSIASEWEKII